MRHADPDDAATRHLTTLATLGGVVSAALLILGAYASAGTVVAAYALSAVVLAWGWPHLLALPRPSTSSIVLGVGAVAMVVVDGYADDADGLRWLPVALAVGLVVAFLHELLRTDGRAHLVLSIAGAAFGLAILASGANVAAAAALDHGDDLVAIGLGAAALSLVVDLALHRSRRAQEWALPVSLVLGAALGLLLAATLDVRWSVALLLGLVAAGLSQALRRVVASLSTQTPGAQLALGVSSVLVSGFLPYAAAWYLAR